jgi:mevalonate kinase
VYAGYKTPTAEVLAWVADHWQNRPDERDALYNRMGAITQHAYQALEQQAWSHFYKAVSDYQIGMAELGVSDATLEQLLSLAHRAQLGAAKISGSGLGDCIIVFSDQAKQIDQWFAQAEMQAWQCFSLPITPDGADMISL